MRPHPRFLLLGLALACSCLPALAAQAPPVATATISPAGLTLQPLVEYDFGLLVVTGADGTVARRPLSLGESILFAPLDDAGRALADGVYRWELRLVTEPAEETERAAAAARERGDEDAMRRLRGELQPRLRRLSGILSLRAGVLETVAPSEAPSGTELSGGPDDIVISNGEPRLTFDDTDMADDSFFIEADASALSVVESDSSTTIFTMEDGVVGLFTDAPDDDVELHVVDGLPEIRFDNTSSVWDLRTATNDFQIVDSTPFFPETVLEIEKTGTVYDLNFQGGAIFEGDFSTGSSRALKRDLQPAPGHDLLGRLRELPLYSWSYIRDPEGVRHLGPIAEDFHRAFGLGKDDKHISPADSAGLALAAIQALADQLESRDREILELRRRLEALEAEKQTGPSRP